MSDSPKKPRRRLLGGINAVVIGVAVVLIAIVINAIFSQVFWRFDVTDHKIYTLSEVSHQAAADLEEPVEVRAFISPNMPPPFHQLDRQVEELLMEYEAASGGMLRFEIISPDEGDDVAELAAGYGIEKVTIGRQTDTSRSFQEVYKGVAFVQGDRVETLGDLQASGRPELDNFEYEFTRSLLNLSDDEPHRVGFLTGAGGPIDSPQFVEAMRPVFREMYGDLIELVAVELTEEIDEDISALIAVNISDDLGDDGLAILDRFIYRGGNLGWFQSGAVIDEDGYREQLQQMQAAGATQRPIPRRKRVDSDLVSYLRTLGIHFGADAVIDREKAMAYGAVPTAQGAVQVSHPALFPITDIDHDLPFVRHFSTLILPLPSTVGIDQTALPEGARTHSVLRTPESSVRLPSAPDRAIYEELTQRISGEQPGAHVVASTVIADFSEQGGEPSRILVVGSGDFMGEYPEIGYRGELSGLGMQFFLNSVEWLAQDRELADIRGKAMPALIAEVPREARQSIQFINIVVVPAFFASIGIVMMVRRRRRKEALIQQAEVEESP